MKTFSPCWFLFRKLTGSIRSAVIFPSLLLTAQRYLRVLFLRRKMAGKTHQLLKAATDLKNMITTTALIPPFVSAKTTPATTNLFRIFFCCCCYFCCPEILPHSSSARFDKLKDIVQASDSATVSALFLLYLITEIFFCFVSLAASTVISLSSGSVRFVSLSRKSTSASLLAAAASSRCHPSSVIFVSS